MVDSDNTRIKIDQSVLEDLERLSLVDCVDAESLAVLEDTINFANKIKQIDTTGVEPFVAVHYDL